MLPYIFSRTADTRSNGGGDARSRHYTTQAAAHQMSHPTVAPRDTLEQSWIYALCMRCRVEYNTPSWEPKHWQRVCPFPLCPSYRQFANILSIFLIGEWCGREWVGRVGESIFGSYVPCRVGGMR